jgi:hypothetical protein
MANSKGNDGVVLNFLMRNGFKWQDKEVVTEDGVTYLKLKDIKIAALGEDGRLWISTERVRRIKGFKTKCKDLLNELPNVKIVQTNFEWILNGTRWTGKPICVLSTASLDINDFLDTINNTISNVNNK